MNSKLWIRKALTMSLTVAIFATYSMVALAADGRTAGEIVITGNTGAGAVTVNGEPAKSGRTIFSSDQALQDAIEVADAYAVDGLMGTAVAYTQGGLARFESPGRDRTVSMGWGGAGGQMVRFAPELGIAIAYVTNTLGSRMAMNDPRGVALLDAAVGCAAR